MKRTTSEVIKIVICYFSVFFLINLVVTMIYKYSNVIDLDWKYIWTYTISNQVLKILQPTSSILIIESMRIAINGIVLAICTSYIFATIICKPPKIVFPEKLVIRYRTTGTNEGEIALGVLIGSKRENALNNVVCRLSCSYIVKKSEKGDLLKNREFEIEDTIGSIRNFYRFSFCLKDLPVGLLRNYLTKTEESIQNDVITITLFGKTNDLNREFYVSKNYKLSDIIISNQIKPEENFKRNRWIVSGTKINWHKFVEVIEDGEAIRSRVITDIEKIIEQSCQKKDEKTNRKIRAFVKKHSVEKNYVPQWQSKSDYVNYLEMKTNNLQKENKYLENMARRREN